MKKELIFEANTLEEAYSKASSELECSIADIKFEIIQYPSGGFLGFFNKKAIVKVLRYKNKKIPIHSKKPKIKINDVSSKLEKIHENKKEVEIKAPKIDKNEDIFDDFYKSEEQKKAQEEVVKEVKEKINELFSNACFKIDEIKVSILDKETLYIEFDGEDAALLIGKEGYRYKALSYILFNWIYDKYGYKVKLEVAEFYKNQELAIENYLRPIYEIIREEKFYKTKPLDGILVTIALNKLRNAFPHMYIATKTNEDGQKYIIVNEYKKN